MRPLRRQPIAPPAAAPDPDPVVVWRTDRLLEAGFSLRLAEAVGSRRDHDLHALLELTDRGCPAELAVRITAPLRDEDPWW
jgi:hypothetical protein